MEQFVIIPAPKGSQDYVELTRRDRKVHGTLWRKHILNLGDLIHPKTGERLKLDDGWYSKLQQNFDAGVCDIVAAPLANDKNEHVEGPLRNGGEVVGIEREGNKVYSLVDVRDPEVTKGLRNKTILGASAFLSLDYTDTSSGKKVGPALLHHCFTNRPYVTGLDDYEEVVAASADYEGDDVIVLASPEGTVPTKEEMLAALKAEHGIDVEALQEQAGKADLSQFTAALTEALRPAGDVQLTRGETVGLADVIGAVAELAQTNVELTGKVTGLEQAAAEREVDGYIGVGRLLPKSRRKAIELVLSGDREGLDDFLAPENAPYVKLNHTEGAAPPQGEQRHIKDLDQEIMRLTAAPEHAHMFNQGQK